MSGTEEKVTTLKPGNADWQSRKEAAFARAIGTLAPVYIEHAKNAEMWDVEGQRYVDFATGIAVCSTGHTNPKVTAAVQQQLQRFSHTCFGITPYGSAVELAEKLNELAPGNTPKKTMFVTTGAEAVENCVKIARAYTGRRGVIAFNGGFHGRTMMAMGLTGKVTPYKNLFGPLPGDIYHVPFPVEYHGITLEQTLGALNTLFQVNIAASDVAAIIVEPVQGEGGFYPASNEFLQAMRMLCDEHGIVLIADEIQSGFARTGKFFCCEYAGVEPDLMTVAKGMAGGFPLAAVVGKAAIMDAPLPGGLGGTYAGSPIGCAAALAVIDVIAEENLVERANQIGTLFAYRLSQIQQQCPDVIGDIRARRGAMIAMELVKNGDPDSPDPDLTTALVTKAWQNGLILLSCGIRGNVIRFLPALTISDELIDEGMNIVERCLTELLS
ncbi:MAG: 4-aminobutyrate--2-oxoglutarate transaminase [Xanthomonadales bacterium]|nr:4-aminobutyrate--2-oxoglutarate transaminase [Xanthomonadales bacterium]